MIDYSKEAKAIGRILRGMLDNAKAAGIEKPSIYIEGEGSIYVLDESHPKIASRQGADSQEAIVGSGFIGCSYDVGAW